MATFDELRLQQLLGPFNNQMGIVNTTNSRPFVLNNLYNTANDDLVQQVINQRISALGNVAPMPVNISTGIISTPQATNMFTDDAGLEEESYEKFSETGTVRSGLRSLFDNIKNSKVANFALSAINPIFGAASGIASFFNRPGFQDFKSSSTLKEFFQKQRDRKARELAAQRGADKQRIDNLKNFNQNFKSYFSGDGGGNTGGGNKGGGTFGDSVNDTGSFSDYS